MQAKKCKTSFSPFWVFLYSRYSLRRWWGKVLWLLWVGRARHPGPFSGSMTVEVFNVGGWLTHGDMVLETSVDFLAVVEHRLVPARVRGEWARLRAKGASSVWSPASQASSHVGHGGVGVISLRGAPLSLPTSATAQFRRFFDCGRALRCVASGRFLHLVVLYGYQGADGDAEQLSLTDQLFNAALGELGVVVMDQPCLIVGDFNVEPTKIPCLSKGISAGLWVDLESAWAFASGVLPAPTCERSWTAVGGHRRDFVLGCPLAAAAAAAILSCNVQPDRWIAPHLAVRALFDCGRWDSWVTQPVRCTPLWPASWLPTVDKTRGSKSVEVRRVWEIYDERLQFMSRRDALLLDESLVLDDVSMAWTVWSRAAESALADAYRFSGGSLPSGGLILGGSGASFRRVQLGEWIRRARANAADAHDAADVFLYRDFSVAPLLDMRRRSNAVMNILDAMIRCGVSLSRSVELTAQWDQILAIGPIYPVTGDDLSVGHGLGVGAFFDAAAGVHRRLCEFIHQVVVNRRDEAVRGWRNWIREDPLVHPYRWLRPDLVPPAPFLQCEPCLGKGRPALTNSALRLMCGCRFFLRFIYLG